MRTSRTLSAFLTTLAIGSPALAQTPAPPPAAPPAHHGILGRIFHRPATPGAPAAGTAPITGGIVGNKNSHVYHLPGDKGALPSAQNRVYFRTEAQAIAAGYHKAGAGIAKPHKTATPAMKPTR